MCEILVRLQNGSCPEVESNPLRGYIVVLKPDGHAWGRCEVPPEYGTVSVPGLDPTTVVERERPWRMAVDFSLVSSDPANDAYTYTVAATAFNTRTGEGKLTEARLVANKAAGLFAAWGATGITYGDNAVTFSVRIADAYRTSAFWGGKSLVGYTLTDLSYNQATGVHRVRLTYPATLTAKEVEDLQRICDEVGTFVSINTSTRRIVVDISRANVRAEFMEAVKQKVNSIILRRRRFRISEAACQQIEAAGGHITATIAQANAALVDHRTE